MHKRNGSGFIVCPQYGIMIITRYGIMSKASDGD